MYTESSTYFGENWGCQGDGYQNYGLLGCDTM